MIVPVLRAAGGKFYGGHLPGSSLTVCSFPSGYPWRERAAACCCLASSVPRLPQATSQTSLVSRTRSESAVISASAVAHGIDNRSFDAGDGPSSHATKRWVRAALTGPAAPPRNGRRAAPADFPSVIPSTLRSRSPDPDRTHPPAPRTSSLFCAPLLCLIVLVPIRSLVTQGASSCLPLTSLPWTTCPRSCNRGDQTTTVTSTQSLTWGGQSNRFGPFI